MDAKGKSDHANADTPAVAGAVENANQQPTKPQKIRKKNKATPASQLVTTPNNSASRSGAAAENTKVDNQMSTTPRNLSKRKRKGNKAAPSPSQLSISPFEMIQVKSAGNTMEKLDNALVTTTKNPRKKNKKRKTTSTIIGSADADSSKNKDTMGMIFMCNSKTKQDCYNYKIFGMPATKKDTVAKIYKGMRLFLFDIDLKQLYGIYKAAGPGGYDIEPKAFNSAFPSQVRFSLLQDCLPLAEDKFKAVIKDNYYGKNKFDCLLKAEQVKNLCKLFNASGKSQESKDVGRVRKTEAPSFVDRSKDKQKARARDRNKRQGWNRDIPDKERRQERNKKVRQIRDGVRNPASDRGRMVAVSDGVYGREAPQSVLNSVLPAYVYERPLDMDYYRVNPIMEHREGRLTDLELNRQEIVYLDPHGHMDFTAAHEPPLPYRESLYTRAPVDDQPPLSYHESLYTRAPQPVHETPLSYHESFYTRAPMQPVHETPLSYHEVLHNRAPMQPVHETPLAYHESLYTRAPQPAHEVPLSYYESYPRAPPSYHLSTMYHR